MEIDLLINHTVCHYCGEGLRPDVAARAEEAYREATNCTVEETSDLIMAHLGCAQYMFGPAWSASGTGWFVAVDSGVICRPKSGRSQTIKISHTTLGRTIHNFTRTWERDLAIEARLKNYGGVLNEQWIAYRVHLQSGRRKTGRFRIVNKATWMRFETINSAEAHANTLMLASLSHVD